VSVGSSVSIWFLPQSTISLVHSKNKVIIKYFTHALKITIKY